MVERTCVAIVGAGPAGLVLGNLLLEAGIDCVILERQSRAYVEGRVRAGLLEEPTVSLFREHGWADRMLAEGMTHVGTELRFDRQRLRLDYGELVGRSMQVYPQQEVVADLIAVFLAAGGELHFEVPDVDVADLDSSSPLVTWTDAAGVAHRTRCDLVAGCDGFFGVCRTAIPAERLQVFDQHHPFGWVAVLAQAPPSTHEIIYAVGPNGFAGHMLRTTTISRYYLQCEPGDDIANWSDDRIWSELQLGLATNDGWTLTEGPVIEKNIVEMRSYLVGELRHGRLFLAGDAAHIVPPVGAKGMNLAICDAWLLFTAIERWRRTGEETGFDRYSPTCLERVWRIQDFSLWMAAMLHPLPAEHPQRAFAFERARSQFAELRRSRAYATHFAENYVGLPYPDLFA